MLNEVSSRLIVRRAARGLRTELFATRPREVTTSLSVHYTGTAPDPRIDAVAMDYFSAQQHALGVYAHYVVKTNGIVEIGRAPMTISTRTRNYVATAEAIHIGVVGGYDPATGERVHTTTPEQARAVEQLIQALADALGVPLEVHDSRERWTRDDYIEIAEAADAILDAREGP